MVDENDTKKVGIVISSAGADEAFANKLKDGLEDLYRVWYYKQSMVPEENNWDVQIDKALKTAQIVIGVISPAAVAAPNVRKEWLWVEQFAREHGVIFLLVEHQSADPGHQFAAYTWTSFASRPFEDALRDLRVRIRHALNRRITAAVDAINPEDPHARYLTTLFNRIQKMLMHLIIPSREADPIDLASELIRDGVAVTEESSEFVDFVMQRVGANEQFRTVNEAFVFFKRRMLLLGPPGSGKTVSWLVQIRDAIVERLHNQIAPIPIIANIQSWDGTPLIDWLAKYPFTPGDTRKLIEEGRAILFIDGLDELSNMDKSPANHDRFKLHREFMKQLPTNCAVLVTCRMTDYEDIGTRIPLNGAVGLKPLEEDQIEDFLRHLPDLYRIVKDDVELMQMVSTPLYLSMFAFTCEQMRPEKRAHLLTAVGNAAMFRERLVIEYIRQLYDFERRRRKERTLPVTVDRLMEGLGKVAMRNVAFYRIAKNSFSRNELNLMSSSQNGDEREQMIDLALSLGLLQPHENNRYKFIHMMVRDVLAFHYCTNHCLEVSEYTDGNANIALALGQLNDVRTTQLLRIILEKVPRESVRKYVSKAFGYNRDPDTVKDLLRLLRDSDEFVQSFAIEGLAGIHQVQPIDVQVIDAVIATMKSSSSRHVHAAACVALGIFGSDKAIDPLIEVLKGGSSLLVPKASAALARLNAQRAIPVLREAYQRFDELSRVAIIEALGKLHDEQSLPILLKIVRNEKKSQTLTTAIDALARIASPSAVPELIRRLSQTPLSYRDELSGDVRVAIASALGAIGDPQAIPVLKDALREEKNERTYNYIFNALRSLGCDDIPMFDLPTFEMDTDPGDTDSSTPIVYPAYLSEAPTRSPDEDDATAHAGNIPFH